MRSTKLYRYFHMFAKNNDSYLPNFYEDRIKDDFDLNNKHVFKT